MTIIMDILYLTEKNSTIWHYSPIAYQAFKGQECKGKGPLCQLIFVESVHVTERMQVVCLLHLVTDILPSELC